MNFENNGYPLAWILAVTMTAGSLHAQDESAQAGATTNSLPSPTSASAQDIDENSSKDGESTTEGPIEINAESKAEDNLERVPRRLPFPIESNLFYDSNGALLTDIMDVHSIQLIEVPIERRAVELDQISDNIWAKGPKPKSNFLAALDYSSLSEASIMMPDASSARVYKAKRNTFYPASSGAPEGLVTQSTIYCGRVSIEQSLPQNVCLHDSNDDGLFDRIAFARSEAIDEHAVGTVLMFPSAPLQTPLSYTPVGTEDRSVLEFEIRNCGKDWDNPHYSIARKVSSAADDDIAVQLLALLSQSTAISKEDEALLRFALEHRSRSIIRPNPPCPKGNEIESYGTLRKSDLGKKHILVDLDGLIFSVGPKNQGAPAKLLAARKDMPVMRLEAGVLAGSDTGLSKLQKQVATSQAFDRPAYMSTGEIHIKQGVLGVGETLFEVPFEYGYMGELTETARINTILSSRSVEGGSVLYGIPTQMRQTLTINGIPKTPIGGVLVGDHRRVSTQLTWCNPVSEEKELGSRYAKVRQTETVWTATCFSQIGDKHSIIKGQKPAFMVSSMRHTTGISTNDGKPPIQPLDQHSFDAPTVLKYSIEETENGDLALKQGVWFGDLETSSRTMRLYYSPNAGFGKPDGPDSLTWETGNGIVTVHYADDVEKGGRKFKATLTKPAEKGARVNFSQSRGPIFGF